MSHSPAATHSPLLEVRDLRTVFHTDAGVARAVDGVSLTVDRGKTLAVVGESGCGKSVTALSLLRLVPSPPGAIVGGEIRFGGRDLLQLSEAEMRRVRGGAIAMIFQEPGTSLNPVFTVGRQIAEALELHRPELSRAGVRAEVVAALQQVQIRHAERRARQYPHELSGGMKQRVMIAMGLACRPQLLIADEPTTALDVTIQAEILDLLRQVQRQRGMGLLLITHDLGVVAEMADDVAVMYAGRVVEYAPVLELFETTQHPYTRALFLSLPRIDERRERLHAIRGTVPSATDYPSGCRYRPRCDLNRWLQAHDPGKAARCHQEPPLEARGPDHRAACWWSDLEGVESADPEPVPRITSLP